MGGCVSGNTGTASKTCSIALGGNKEYRYIQIANKGMEVFNFGDKQQYTVKRDSKVKWNM